MGENGRELVLDMLLEMERQKEYSHRLVRPSSSAFASELWKGSWRWIII